MARKAPSEKAASKAHGRKTDNPRKGLSADALLILVREGFGRIPDYRPPDADISLPDALMSGFAMFSLKDPSLLAFDQRRNDENLKSVYHIENIPCDTYLRTILDPLDPESLRPLFKDVFRQLQRGKALEPFVFYEGCYLLSLDGSGYFSSHKIHCPSCMQKTSKNGEVTYYHQMLGAAIVHPDLKEVIPLMPEPIIKQDGETKNDCERNAAKRFFHKLRRDHPHLGLIVIEDALSSNAPHIRELQDHNLHYILGVKEGDHGFLFEQVRQAERAGRVTVCEYVEEATGVRHRFRFLNEVPLNESNQDLLVNFLEYWEIHTDGHQQHFSWVSDFRLEEQNVYRIMRGGRARWKIENETFNTLKNQGYQFEHNFGHGQQNLSVVFALLMMLAFLVDQTQQLCCPLFRKVWKKLGSKKMLWERMRSFFREYIVYSMQEIFEALYYGYERPRPLFTLDSS
jgi:hypothetical protein